uniref:O-antigen ligase family protein n=1 Tax=Aliarcobacter sp. TaxID=2321116 RepID=UPI004048BA5A
MNLIINDYKNRAILKLILFCWILSIPFKNAVYQISVVLLIVYFLVELLKTRNFEILIDNLKKIKYLSFGFFLIIFSMIFSNLLNLEHLDKKSWHLILMFFLRYGFVFVILAYYYRLKSFRKKELLFTLYLSFSFVALTGFFEIIKNPEVVLGLGLTGTLDNRNAFGLFMGMGFVLSLLLVEKNKNLGFFLLLIFSFLMIFSFSRSSWVASFGASFIFILINYKKIKTIHFIYLLVFIFFLFILYFAFESVQQRVAQLLEGNSSNRTTIWIHTVFLIKEKIYFGYGLDSWMNLGDSYLKQFPDPHNMILEITLYTGLLGLFFVFFTIFCILFEIYKHKNYLFFPVAFYFLIITQFDFGAFYSKEILSFLTIFVFFVYSQNFEEKQ